MVYVWLISKTKQATGEQVDKTRLSTVLIEVIISGQMLTTVLKVNWTRFKLNVQNLIFTILMFKMVNMNMIWNRDQLPVILILTQFLLTEFSTDFPVFPTTTTSIRRVWPVDRRCLLFHGTWSHRSCLLATVLYFVFGLCFECWSLSPHFVQITCNNSQKLLEQKTQMIWMY